MGSTSAKLHCKDDQLSDYLLFILVKKAVIKISLGTHQAFTKGILAISIIF